MGINWAVHQKGGGVVAQGSCGLAWQLLWQLLLTTTTNSSQWQLPLPLQVTGIFPKTRIGFSSILHCRGTINNNPHPWHYTDRCICSKRNWQIFSSWSCPPVPLTGLLRNPTLSIRFPHQSKRHTKGAIFTETVSEWGFIMSPNEATK